MEKVAIVVGASSGIGREIAYGLSARGYRLILCARREKELTELSTHLSGKAEAFPCDVSKMAQCYDLYQNNRSSDVSILVNAAGFGVFGPFDKTPVEQELEMLDVNVRAVHLLTKLFLRDFKDRGNGLILNIASSAGFMPGPLMASYYASKAYVLRLSQAIAEELRQEGSPVKVCCLCPGPVSTPFQEKAGIHESIKGMDAKKVAEYALTHALKGKTVIVPGLGMKIGLFAQKILPERLITPITYQIQKKKSE